MYQNVNLGCWDTTNLVTIDGLSLSSNEPCSEGFPDNLSYEIEVNTSCLEKGTSYF